MCIRDSYQPSELIGIVHRLALALLEAPPVGLLPASRPHIKLLFSSPADATLAGASILTPDTPVSCLGHPSALGPRDGAFIVVSPGAAAAGSTPIARSPTCSTRRAAVWSSSSTRRPARPRAPRSTRHT